MPRRYIRRKKRTKGKAAKKRRRGNPNRGLRTALIGNPTAITPIGRTLKANLKYATTVNLNPLISGVLANNTYSANGMYDVDISGTGAQPRGFDQLMTLYDHYTVIASSVQISFFNTDSTHAAVCGVTVTDAAGSYPNSLVEAQESPDTIYSVVGPKLSGSDITTIKRSISPPKWLGSGKSPLSNDLLQGDASANPSEQCYYQVWCGAMDASNDNNYVTCNLVFNFTAIFKEPKNPPQS